MTKCNVSNAKKVICVTTGKLFNCIKDGAEYYNTSYQNISKVCKGKYKTTGKLKDGTKLVWSYFYEEMEMAI